MAKKNPGVFKNHLSTKLQNEKYYISYIKGVQKKCPRSKFENGLLTRTVCPRRLSFSQFGVLMSTLNCEKDSLLGQSVLVKRPLLSLDMKTKVIEHVESD